MRFTSVPVMGPVIVVPCVGVSPGSSMACMLTVFGTMVARKCIASTALMAERRFESGLVCEIWVMVVRILISSTVAEWRGLEIVVIPIVTIIVRSE